MEKLKEQLNELLESLCVRDLVYLHNEYCSATNGFDDVVYIMDEFDEIIGGQDPWWIACRVFYGNFNPNDDFFGFSAYGNLVSFDEYTLKDHIYIEDIVDYITDNMDNLFNDEVQEILDEWQAMEDREKLEDYAEWLLVWINKGDRKKLKS